MGYLDNEKSTWSCFDSEGFFHTGDSGYLQKTGDVILTGRIKELIITSGGENISPVPIELAMQDVCPLIAHCFIVGDDQKYLSALLTLKVRHNGDT
jgi:long-chain-fatty-acid--CoA ligase ACSBG